MLGRSKAHPSLEGPLDRRSKALLRAQCRRSKAPRELANAEGTGLCPPTPSLKGPGRVARRPRTATDVSGAVFDLEGAKYRAVAQRPGDVRRELGPRAIQRVGEGDLRWRSPCHAPRTRADAACSRLHLGKKRLRASQVAKSGRGGCAGPSPRSGTRMDSRARRAGRAVPERSRQCASLEGSITDCAAQLAAPSLEGSISLCELASDLESSRNRGRRAQA